MAMSTRMRHLLWGCLLPSACPQREDQATAWQVLEGKDCIWCIFVALEPSRGSGMCQVLSKCLLKCLMMDSVHSNQTPQPASQNQLLAGNGLQLVFLYSIDTLLLSIYELSARSLQMNCMEWCFTPALWDCLLRRQQLGRRHGRLAIGMSTCFKAGKDGCYAGEMNSRVS